MCTAAIQPVPTSQADAHLQNVYENIIEGGGDEHALMSGLQILYWGCKPCPALTVST
jgi:hypothetical protein